MRPAARCLVPLALALSVVSVGAPLHGQSIREVFERVNHAVVVVYTSQTEYELRSSGVTAVSAGGLGSGVLIGPTRVLTAAHVVQAANEVMVEFPNGEKIRASVVSSRQSHDVAMLELERPATVAPVTLGDSDSVAVGDQVFVVGAPLGQAFTLTVGYVSARRTTRDMLGGSSSLELIQTDAAINQGNSGGPMFSLDGTVVGIVSHILSASGGSQGLGYAVSANSTKEALMEGPSFWAGLEGKALTGGLAALFNVPSPGGGILVQHVAEGSLAKELGLRPSVIPARIGDVEMLVGGDIIVMVQGIPVGSELEGLDRIFRTVAALQDGETVLVTVLRAGRSVVLSGPLRR